MAENTKISWCDSTINFWEGCTKVSPGCQFCYAEARDKRFTGGKLWGKGAPRRKSNRAANDALAMNRKPWICDECGEAQSDVDYSLCRSCHTTGSFHRRRIFSLSLGDWLDDEVPIEWLAEMLDTIRKCDQVTWMLCSKRWENFNERLTAVLHWSEAKLRRDLNPLWNFVFLWGKKIKIPPNIIGLCSVENQNEADKRIPHFLTVPLACRGLSMEPLLGPVDLEPSVALWKPRAYVLSPRYYINWLIIGGESGPSARPCNVDWIRSIVQQGQAAGVATFVKQLGAKPVETLVTYQNGMPLTGSGKTPFEGQITDKKGGDPSEWPTDLRIQQWPKGF